MGKSYQNIVRTSAHNKEVMPAKNQKSVISGQQSVNSHGESRGKTMNKRTILLIMIAVLAIGTAACARGKPSSAENTTPAAAATTQTVASPTNQPTRVVTPTATTVMPTARPRPSNSTATAAPLPTRTGTSEIKPSTCVPMDQLVAKSVTEPTLATYRDRSTCLTRTQLDALPDNVVTVWRDSVATWTERAEIKDLTVQKFRDLIWVTSTGTQTQVSLP